MQTFWIFFCTDVVRLERELTGLAFTISYGVWNAINDLAIDSRNPQTVYVATDGRTFITVDGGSRWWPLRAGLGPNPALYAAERRGRRAHAEYHHLRSSADAEGRSVSGRMNSQSRSGNSWVEKIGSSAGM